MNVLYDVYYTMEERLNFYLTRNEHRETYNAAKRSINMVHVYQIRITKADRLLS